MQKNELVAQKLLNFAELVFHENFAFSVGCPPRGLEVVVVGGDEFADELLEHFLIKLSHRPVKKVAAHRLCELIVKLQQG